MKAIPASEALDRMWTIWARLKRLDDPYQKEAAIHDLAVNVRSDMIWLLDLASTLLQEKIDERNKNS